MGRAEGSHGRDQGRERTRRQGTGVRDSPLLAVAMRPRRIVLAPHFKGTGRKGPSFGIAAAPELGREWAGMGRRRQSPDGCGQQEEPVV